MKLTENKTNFEPCPEYTGKAVCVDVTPLKKVQSDYGEREIFRIVFEIEERRAWKDDKGDTHVQPWTVWSTGFTPSIHEKSNLRKFLRSWFGRDLTEAEREGFDTETLIGKPAFIVVSHTTEDKTIYANIASCTPYKGSDPLTPSGKFVRMKDRKKDGNAGEAASYRSTDGEKPAEADATDFLATKIHVGRHKGCELRELTEESVGKMVEHWLPGAKSNPKPTADDRRLIAALEWFVAEQKKKAEAAAAAQAEKETDDVPY